MSEYDFMDEARQLAAQCWCDPETSSTEMDVVLAEAIAKRIALWMQDSAQNHRNTEYYRGLVVQIGESIGKESYISDDGSVQQDVLCAKVPELVDRLNARIKELEDLLLQRDGGDHDNDCKVNYGRGCNCLHDAVTRYFEKRQNDGGN